jgi:hypothetical protein|uniref:Uncharacterized protein n=1 Tax=Zea mays TaxID=4577 RepID=A0A804P1C4_MAIZE
MNPKRLQGFAYRSHLCGLILRRDEVQQEGARHDHPMPLFPSDDVAGGGDEPRGLRHRGARAASVEHVGQRLGGAAPPDLHALVTGAVDAVVAFLGATTSRIALRQTTRNLDSQSKSLRPSSAPVALRHLGYAGWVASAR